MRKLLTFICICFLHSGIAQLTMLPSGGNKKAMVGEKVGMVDITVKYSRPAVKGREGKIWGGLVYTGYSDLGFGNTKAAPWRAGANESTNISFSKDVLIEGKPLAAGTYGLFIAYGPDESTVIFSKNASSWGSYYYDEKEDALRVNVKSVVVNEKSEWLKYEFVNQTESGATIQLVWEKTAIPFKVETDVVNDVLASLRNELRTDKGFNWIAWYQAAQWCAERKVNQDQALQWADSATSATFGGNNQFLPYTVKAQLLNQLGRKEEATATMNRALPFASMLDMHQYGRSLISEKRYKEALEVFQKNAHNHPREFTTLMGLARGHSANGDYKTALKYAQQALPLAPDTLNKNNLEKLIGKLKMGEDINTQ